MTDKITEKLAEVLADNGARLNMGNTVAHYREEAEAVMMYYREIKIAEYRAFLEA